jgi:hypothetical protein
MHDTAQFDHQRLPQDIGLYARPLYLDPRVDPAVAGLQRDDRVFARTTSPHAVVCLPASTFPSVEDGVPLFSEISKVQGSQSVRDIETCLEAVRTHLAPTFGPAGCYYSVRVRSVQSTSNTPGRFLADLRSLDGWASAVEDATKTPSSETHILETIGSCLWETNKGWFFLEATQLEREETWGLTYGLLRYGPPLDSTAITSFFEATTERPPNTFAHWPVRQLYLSGAYEPPVERLESTGDVFESNPEEVSPHPWFAGENPLFGVRQTEAGLADVETDDLYEAIASVSTLLYDSSSLDRDPEESHLKRIVAMDPPCPRTVFVTAAVDTNREL